MSEQASTIRQSLILSFAQKYTNFLLVLPTMMIVSRLLTPAQIGVYSVAQSFLMIMYMLRDFGVSDYLVQVQKLDEAVARTAFTVTLCIAWGLAAMLFMSSAWIAGFFREPLLVPVTQILSINLVLIPFVATIKALLQRSMQFGILYRISLGRQVVQSTTVVMLAALGFGTMSLVWGSIGAMVATVIGCLFWGRSHRFCVGFGLTDWRGVIDFGLQRTLSGFASKLGQVAPDFVIGRLLGFAEVGLYSRGFGLVNMFRRNVLGAVSRVAYPAFSREQRKAGSAHWLFLKSVTYVTGISFPFLAFSAMMAFPIMRIMFGSQWDAAVPVLQLLAIATLVQTSCFGVAQFFLSIGNVRLVTRVVVITQGLRIVAIILTAFVGINAVAASQIVVSLFAVFAWYLVALRFTTVAVKDIWTALRPSLVVAGFSMLVPVVVCAVMPPSEGNLWVPFVLAGTGAVAGWLLGIWVCQHPLWSELDSVVRLYRQRRTVQE